MDTVCANPVHNRAYSQSTASYSVVQANGWPKLRSNLLSRTRVQPSCVPIVRQGSNRSKSCCLRCPVVCIMRRTGHSGSVGIAQGNPGRPLDYGAHYAQGRAGSRCVCSAVPYALCAGYSAGLEEGLRRLLDLRWSLAYAPPSCALCVGMVGG